MDNPALGIMLPIELTNGNDGRGSTFWSSNKRRQDMESELRLLGHVRQPFDEKVALVRVTRILGKRQRLWDPDSIGRGSAKELIDSLVACGWFVDDSAKWIENVDYRQDDTQRDKGPATRIEVFKDEPIKEV